MKQSRKRCRTGSARKRKGVRRKIVRKRTNIKKCALSILRQARLGTEKQLHTAIMRIHRKCVSRVGYRC